MQSVAILNRVVVRISFLISIVLLTACSSMDPLRDTSDADSIPNLPSQFGDRPDIISLGDIHRLSPAQEMEFFDYYDDPANLDVEPHLRLADFLFNNANNFLYENRTYSASEALSLGRGNCMSLAVVTTALASLANLDIQYQLIDSSPVFELKDTVANKGLHIRSLIFRPQTEDDLSPPSGVKIDYFPGEEGRFIGNVDYPQYIALYYRNIAAEALSEGNYNAAYWYSLESMIYEPLSPDALNMLAVTYKRVGSLAKAEEIYRYGIVHAENKLTLLKNYYILLNEMGREEEARAVNRRLTAMDDPSPVHWFNVARFSYETNDFNDAILFYSRAIEIAPYLHEAHLGIALSYYRLGNYEKAQAAFQQAMNNVNDVMTRERYETKLEALQLLL